MFLGLFTLGSTLACHIQLAAGNAPVTADAAPTFRIYAGSQSTPIATGTCSGVVDSQIGFHLLSQALTTGNGFAAGAYTIRVAYAVATVAAVQEFSFQIV